MSCFDIVRVKREVKEATNFVWDKTLGTWMNKKHVNTLGNVQCSGDNYHCDHDVGDTVPNEIVVVFTLLVRNLLITFE